MELEKILEEYQETDLFRRQGVFASIFILQNRLQTACDKLDPEISMKQWLLLAMAETGDQAMTLTKLGGIDGCSRQNVKKIAQVLEKKGFIKLEKKENHSRALCVLRDERMRGYAEKVGKMQAEVLELLFQEFTEDEIEKLYQCTMKLYKGIQNVEKYAEESHE